MTNEELGKLFTKEHGGPNPYYKCNGCGYVEVGVKEYLEAHANSCRMAESNSESKDPQ